MSKKYNEIMELYGADGFKDIIKKWDILSENVNVVTGRPRIILPDLLWIMNSGVGRTNLLNHPVATRFGGKYAKKVLVATQELHSVLSRASEMNIEVIDNLGKCGFDENITKQKFKNALK